MEEKWLVYVHWIELDGVIKRYFGITHHQDPKKRWNNGLRYKPHGRLTKSGQLRKPNDSRFYNAIKKYGWDNFTHEVLFEGLTKSEAEEKEIALIAQYETYKDSFGFNQDMGGSSHGKHSEETRKKIKENHADISGTNNVNCKGAVIQLTLQGEFVKEYPSATDAERETGYDADLIRHAAIHDICSCCGYLWFWKEEYDTLDKETIYYKPDNVRPVFQLDSEGNRIARYNSCKEASVAVGGINKSSGICTAIKLHRRYKGYYWEYEHEKYNNVKNKLDRWAKNSKSAVNN